jgi:hypothetical protein
MKVFQVQCRLPMISLIVQIVMWDIYSTDCVEIYWQFRLFMKSVTVVQIATGDTCMCHGRYLYYSSDCNRRYLYHGRYLYNSSDCLNSKCLVKFRLLKNILCSIQFRLSLKIICTTTSIVMNNLLKKLGEPKKERKNNTAAKNTFSVYLT